MLRQVILSGVALGLVSGTALAESEPVIPEEKKRICEKAEKRYQKKYGHPTAELRKKGIHVVLMYRYTFCPPHVTIRQGETVRWVNVDAATSHSVWFKEAGKPESDRVFPDPNEKVEMKFDMPPGDYPYLCGPHWQSDGMMGQVTVLPAK